MGPRAIAASGLDTGYEWTSMGPGKKRPPRLGTLVPLGISPTTLEAASDKPLRAARSNNLAKRLTLGLGVGQAYFCATPSDDT